MCGIVAVIAKKETGLFNKHTKAFEEMLFADQLRGKDGTGIFWANKKKEVFFRKQASDASEFISTKMFSDAITKVFQEGLFVVGHNRAATKGSHTWKNTHPFHQGDITLIHNGTLHSHKELDKNVDVDSHAICTHMAANGYEETLKNVDGAFALVWYNKSEGKLHLARNLQRPLNILDCDDCWIIASEANLGYWIASRNNIKVTSSKVLETETVYTFDLNDLSKYTEEKVEYHKWVSKGNYYSYPTAFSKYYKTGDKIEFTPYEIRVDRDGWYLLGFAEEDEAEVSVQYKSKNFKELEELNKSLILTGTVISRVFYPQGGTTLLVVNNVKKQEISVRSLNGVTLTEEMLKNFPTKCSCCSGHINDKRLEYSYVRLHKGKVETAFCEDCSSLNINEWFIKESA